MIAGEFGGLRLVAPKGSSTRPTTDRVKESVFGALGPARLVGAHVLDGYGGTGALALEALSRGATDATIVERDPRALDAIRRNLAGTHTADRVRVHRRRFAGYLQGSAPTAPFDLVFLDPPYDMNGADLSRILDLLDQPGWLSPDASVVIERGSAAGPPSFPAAWQVTWERVYGDTLVVLVGPDADTPPA